METSVWSYVTQWIGYVSWCASTSDPACRPFTGLLALLGASGGLSALFVLGMVRMLRAWERDVVAAREVRAAVAALQKPQTAAESPLPAPAPAAAPVHEPLFVPPRSEPALGLAVPRPYIGHAEPLLLKVGER